jgi:hypothetical protein
MPRTSNKGGARTGTQGSSYTNRTDLNKQPVRVGPSTQYGQGAAQEASQKIVPLANTAGAPSSGGGAPAAMPPQAPGPLPGDHGAFNRPTEMPQQPVSAGLPFGAGPGPEALGMIQRPKVSQTIAQLASMSNDPELLQLAQRAQAQGQ